MKKIAIILILFLQTNQFIFAQKDSVFYNKKGKNQITFANGTSWMNNRVHTKYINTTFANYNYFISNKVALGVLASIEFSNTNPYTIYFLGNSVKYYPIKKNKWNKLYTEINYMMGNTSFIGDTAYFYNSPKIPYLKLHIGMDFMFYKHWGIEPEVFITRTLKTDKKYNNLISPNISLCYLFKPHDKNVVNYSKNNVTTVIEPKKPKQTKPDSIPKTFDKKDILIGGSLNYIFDNTLGYHYQQVSILPRIAYFPIKHLAVGINGVYVNGFAKEIHPKMYYYAGTYCEYRLDFYKVAFYAGLGASISNHAGIDSIETKRPNTFYMPITTGMDIKISKQLYAEWGFISYKTLNKNLYAMNFYRLGIDYLIKPRKK